MTPRQRVLEAFAHRETRAEVPVDFGSHRSSGISAIAYARLRDHLGLPKRPIRIYDAIQQLAIVDEDVLARFGIDAVEMGRGFALEPEHWRDWVLPDGTPCQLPAWVKPERARGGWEIRSAIGTVIARMPESALYFEQTHFPFAGQGAVEGEGQGAGGRQRADEGDLARALGESMWTSPELRTPPGPLGDGEAGFAALREGAGRLRRQTDRAIVGLFGGNLLEVGQFLYRNDNFFVLLAAEPERAERFLDRLMEDHLKNLERFLSAVGDSIDVVLFGDDLGMQTGPQISPSMYRRFFKPRHSRMWKRAKELAPAGRGGEPARPALRVMLHCCGGVRELLPDLIEAGLDAINPVQISCAGMEASSLKRDFGGDIVFWGGGCDTRGVLPNAEPQEVRDHVRRQVEILARGGGFVFQQVHNILSNVPPRNIEAMFDAVKH